MERLLLDTRQVNNDLVTALPLSAKVTAKKVRFGLKRPLKVELLESVKVCLERMCVSAISSQYNMKRSKIMMSKKINGVEQEKDFSSI